MFTGIVEEIGEVIEVKKSENLWKLEILTQKLADKVDKGDSVAVNGVCLTVTDRRNSVLFFEVVFQTLKNTNLINLTKSDRVNLEKSLSMGEDISGHLVTGHIDSKGKITEIKHLSEGQTSMNIQVPSKLMKFIASKGSICVDGVSLTVAEIKDNSFGVYLTPYTLTNTTFKQRKINDYVNIEVDLIAKYLDRLILKKNRTDINKEFLEKYGFM